jgi:hydrogenase nickel incorporation protein HypB
MCDTCGCGQPPEHPLKIKRIHVVRDVREARADIVEHNRAHLAALGCPAVNLVSAPGAGKTTLLERTLSGQPGGSLGRPAAVIVGDQATDNDAQRLTTTGAPVVQMNTGTGCHLEAWHVHDALHQLDLPTGAIVFIENVGNLICPVFFDLGQTANVVLLSVTEGDEKPEKYPEAFRDAALMVLTKVDLLPHVDFDRGRCFRFARALNPELPIVELSARTGEGMDGWLEWLAELR